MTETLSDCNARLVTAKGPIAPKVADTSYRSGSKRLRAPQSPTAWAICALISLKDYMHCQSDELSTHFLPTFINLSCLYDWGSNLKEKKTETVVPPCDDMTSHCGIEPVQSHFEWVLNHWHTSLRLYKWVSCTFMTWLLTYKANVRPSIIVGCVLQSCSNFFTIYEVTKRVKNVL